MRKPFSAAAESVPFTAPAFSLGLLFAVAFGVVWPSVLVWLSVPCFVFGAYCLFFFRDPARKVPDEPGQAVAAADGLIVGVEDLAQTPYYDGPCKRISIFLSLFDVHINRAPMAGVVRRLEYRRGRFRDARLPETTDVNEANTIYLDTESGPMTVRQIAGLVARRIVCRCGPGDRLATGERFGMIKFGSRTEIYLPPNAQVLVQVGEKVKAGETPVAKFT